MQLFLLVLLMRMDESSGNAHFQRQQFGFYDWLTAVYSMEVELMYPATIDQFHAVWFTISVPGRAQGSW